MILIITILSKMGFYKLKSLQKTFGLVCRCYPQFSKKEKLFMMFNRNCTTTSKKLVGHANRAACLKFII